MCSVKSIRVFGMSFTRSYYFIIWKYLTVIFVIIYFFLYRIPKSKLRLVYHKNTGMGQPVRTKNNFNISVRLLLMRHRNAYLSWFNVKSVNHLWGLTLLETKINWETILLNIILQQGYNLNVLWHKASSVRDKKIRKSLEY